MFRAAAVLIASLSAVAGFSAFGKAARTSRSALKMTFENEIGALPPVGFWDPLGLSADGDAVAFERRRAVELKHGRVAMLAVFGYLTAEFTRLPGNIDLDGTTFSSVPNGLAALGAVPAFGWVQIFLSVGYWDLIGWEQVEGSTPGDFGFGAKYLKPGQEVEQKTKELQNGRLAMLAIMELLTHDVAKPAGEAVLALHHF